MKRACTAALLLAGAATAQAGPWPTGRGSFYAKLSAQRLSSTTLAAPDGTEFTIPTLTKDELSLYGSYGATDRLGLQAYVPFVRSTDLDDRPDELQRQTGVGDVRFGAQWQLGRRGAWVFAARGTAQAPTGDETRAQGLLPTGSGVWEGELVLGAGRSLGGGRGWGFVELGPQFRGGGLRDGLSGGAQLGWNATSRLALGANARLLEPWSHEPPRVARGSFVGVGDRVTWLVLGATAIVELAEGTSLQLDLEHAVRARNLATGPQLSVGVALSR